MREFYLAEYPDESWFTMPRNSHQDIQTLFLLFA